MIGDDLGVGHIRVPRRNRAIERGEDEESSRPARKSEIRHRRIEYYAGWRSSVSRAGNLNSELFVCTGVVDFGEPCSGCVDPKWRLLPNRNSPGINQLGIGFLGFYRTI